MGVRVHLISRPDGPQWTLMQSIEDGSQVSSVSERAGVCVANYSTGIRMQAEEPHQGNGDSPFGYFKFAVPAVIWVAKGNRQRSTKP